MFYVKRFVLKKVIDANQMIDINILYIKIFVLKTEVIDT